MARPVVPVHPVPKLWGMREPGEASASPVKPETQHVFSDA